MKYRKIVIIILLVGLQKINYCNAQSLTIEYSYHTTENTQDSFRFPLLKSFPGDKIGNYVEVPEINYRFIKKGDLNISTCTYSITDTCLGLIGDGFGHEVCLFPSKDTLHIYFEKMTDSDSTLSDHKFPNTGFFNFIYRGRNEAAFQIFDSLNYYTGSVHMDFINLNATGFDLNKFFSLVTERYNKRLAYCNNYFLKNQILLELKELIGKEIESSYVYNLLTPMTCINKKFAQSDYSSQYIDSLKNRSYNDLYYMKRTIKYPDAAVMYTNLFLNNFDCGNSFSNAQLLSVYNLIKTIYSGEVKNYLLATHLERFLRYRPSSFDSLLKDFKKKCTYPIYAHYLDSVSTKVHPRDKTIKFSKVLMVDLERANGKKIIFKKLLFNKPVVIDCWASWCSPCIYQFQYTPAIENEYGKEIDFIYLSFDKNPEAWKKAVHQLVLKENNYLLNNNFKSDFAKYFDITSIPRYIIIDKNGKVISENAPRPSRKEALEKILDKLVKQKKE